MGTVSQWTWVYKDSFVATFRLRVGHNLSNIVRRRHRSRFVLSIQYAESLSPHSIVEHQVEIEVRSTTTAEMHWFLSYDVQFSRRGYLYARKISLEPLRDKALI
jgi:hypothetical protein